MAAERSRPTGRNRGEVSRTVNLVLEFGTALRILADNYAGVVTTNSIPDVPGKYAPCLQQTVPGKPLLDHGRRAGYREWMQHWVRLLG